MSNNAWKRVSRKTRCLVCGKPDWCTFNRHWACCMRVPSCKQARNGGWLHALDAVRGHAPAQVEPVETDAPPPLANAAAMLRAWSERTTPSMIARFAAQLGVAPESLDALGCAWADEYRAWAFPMLDADGHVIGIRLRADNGRKWAVRGSRAGLFYAHDESTAPELCLCEGPTDTAAALSIGLAAVGRPSCAGQETEIIRLLARRRARRLVIVADNDQAGWNGAARLSAMLHIPHVIIAPPAKDIREFVRNGGDAGLFRTQANSMVWRQPS